MIYDDFRGSRFWALLIGLFSDILSSSDNQFGFRKEHCTHAIQTVRNIVNQYIKAGYTANLCAILSKAFDKINLHALFIK